MYTMVVYTMPNLNSDLITPFHNAIVKIFEYHLIIYKPTFMLILKCSCSISKIEGESCVVVILLNLSACHVIVNVLWLFLTVLWVGLQRLIVIFHCHTDHTQSREEVKRSGMDAINIHT